jgi:hypothetical protein
MLTEERQPMIALRQALILWKSSLLSLNSRDIAAIVFVVGLLATIAITYALHLQRPGQLSSSLGTNWDCAFLSTYAEACVKRIDRPK